MEKLGKTEDFSLLTPCKSNNGNSIIDALCHLEEGTLGHTRLTLPLAIPTNTAYYREFIMLNGHLCRVIVY